jgi:hypothetical protein
MGLKIFLVCITHHNISTPFSFFFSFFFLFMYFCSFVKIVFGLGFFCVESESLFFLGNHMPLRWSLSFVRCVNNGSSRHQHGNS